MHSTTALMCISDFAARVASGSVLVDSDLNRGQHATTVWNEARRGAFVVQKIQGFPSQSITLVRVGDDITWKVLDGRNRVRALLAAFAPGHEHNPLAFRVNLIVEMVTVPGDQKHRVAEMFTSLNNRGIPLTAGEARLVASAPSLCDTFSLERRTWDIIQAGRGETEGGEHNPAQTIAASLWAIRDAIHGPGSWQGKPTLAVEHVELFGPGGRRDRDVDLAGFAPLANLIDFVRHLVTAAGHDASAADYEDNVAGVFGIAAHRVRGLGCASMLAMGSPCSGRQKAWLPRTAVLDLILSQSLTEGSAKTWWPYFAAYLRRAELDGTPKVWVDGILHSHVTAAGPTVECRAAGAHAFAAFAHKHCIAESQVMPSRAHRERLLWPLALSSTADWNESRKRPHKGKPKQPPNCYCLDCGRGQVDTVSTTHAPA